MCVCAHAHRDSRRSPASGLQTRGSPSAPPGAAPEPPCVPRPAAEACSTTEDGAEPLLCPSGYECHILSPGDLAAGIPNRGQCVKQRKPAGECRHQVPLALPGTPPWETIPEETPASEPVPTLPRPPTTTLLQATFSLLICTGGGQSPAHRFLPGLPWGQLFQISEPQLPYL